VLQKKTLVIRHHALLRLRGNIHFMQTKSNQRGFNFVTGIICLCLAWSGGVSTIPAQPAPSLGAGSPSLSPLVWDSLLKETSPAPGQASAEFVFHVTNPADSEVVINNVQTSCGCTVAKTPPRPWHLAAHTNDSMTISVNVAGRSGTYSKTITVWATGYQNQVLTVTIHMPDSSEATRARNMQMAITDRQAVFKGDCAACHNPKPGLMSKELFIAACEICHDPPGGQPRATMVPNLRALNHPTDYDFWKALITIGKPGTFMPAFGTVAGGPLTDEQIDSLAKTLTVMIPSSPQTNAMNTLK
jgi:mono/diheme cytochrome c family protein